MDKEFAEVFKEEIVIEGKVEELGKQISGLANKFKEGKDDVMTMADEMITNGKMPDPESIKMLETEESQMVVHLIAKKMGVQWTKDNGYGEMRFKQNYPESHIKKNADRLIEMSKKIKEAKEEVEVSEGIRDFKMGDKVKFVNDDSRHLGEIGKITSLSGNGISQKATVKLDKGGKSITNIFVKLDLIKEEVEVDEKNNDNEKKLSKEVELVNKFGTPAEKKKMAEIQRDYDKMMSIGRIKMNQQVRDAMVKKYSAKLKEEVDIDEASKLPPHLAKFFDEKGDLKPEVAARIAKGREKLNIKDVTPKGYGPKEEVEIDEAKVSDDMINILKKKYESLRGKKLSLSQNQEILLRVKGFPKEGLLQLVKADIPFISLSAATTLMAKYDMKAKDINMANEGIGVEEAKKWQDYLSPEEKKKLLGGKKPHKEGIDIQNASMTDVIKDFKTSDAPQFKGKSDKKKKEMAIAAKLSKEENEDDEPVGKSKKKSKKDVINLKPTAESSMKKFKDMVTKLKEKRFNDVEETTNLKKKEEVEVEESDGYEVDLAAKKIQRKWKGMSKAEKVKFLDKMDVLAGKTKVSDSDLEDILGDYGLYREATGDKEAYQKFFKGVLKKFGVKGIFQLKGAKKKEFFDYIDKNWTADHEEETKKEETMAKKSLKNVVSTMQEKKQKVQEAMTIGGLEVGEQEFDKEQRLDHAAPNLGMTYNDYQARFETNGLEGPYQIDGGAYFWDKMASKWFSVETEDYVDGNRNAELSHRYTKGGTAGGGLLYQR